MTDLPAPDEEHEVCDEQAAQDAPHPDLDLHPADEGRPEWSQRWPKRGGRVWLVLDLYGWDDTEIVAVCGSIDSAERVAEERMATRRPHDGPPFCSDDRLHGATVRSWSAGLRTIAIEEHQVVSR